MSNDRLKYLLKQFATNASTPAEVRELFGWIRTSDDNEFVRGKIKELWENHDNNQELPDVNWDEVYEKIIRTPVIVKRNRWWRHAAAIAAAMVVAIAGYFFLNQKNVNPVVQKTSAPSIQNDLPPGGDKAVLTLADGTQIILDSAGVGALSQQGNMKIIKLSNGQLSYRFANNASGGAPGVLYNTVSTPRGGQYQIELADGSRVWLNAASSLRFPTSFAGSERDVELTGEGYFEVTHNPSKPFNVKVNGVKVKVLGTHFNINAYDDDGSVKTTLLEGSVRVQKGDVAKTIKPGEQARVADVDNEINVRNVDVSDAVAWKNGRFIFHDDNIQSVMKQLARWYDVTVSYEGDITNEEFVGVINRSRYENISEILNMLEKTGTVSFSVIGRHVTVMPYEKSRSVH